MNYLPAPAAKLQPRLAAARLQPRSALAFALSKALAERRLLLLAAPPGYGKTALLAYWLRDHPAAYYCLDPADADAACLLAGLHSALARQVKLDDPTPAAVAALAAADYGAALAPLLGAIEAAQAPVILALDSYEHLAVTPGGVAPGSGVRLLDALLRLAPGNFSVVLAGWGFLPLAELAAARLSGALTQFGAAELAYSRDELATLLAERSLELSRAELEDLYNFTAGWPAGVAAVLQVRAEAGGGPVAAAFNLAAARLSSWLATLFFPALAAPELAFLVATAALPFLQDGLCDFALGRADAALRLHELNSAGLLAWQLWQRTADGTLLLRYGMHPLFRQALLLRQPDAAVIATTVERAAEWCARHGEWAAAATLLLDTGQMAAAAGVLEGAARELLPMPLSPELRALAARLPATMRAPLLAPPLRVTTLGGFAVQRSGVRISDAEWRRTKVKSLLKLLLANYGGRLSRDMILESLWEHLPPDAALNNFNATLSALRHVLEPGLTQGRASQYVIYQEGYCWANTAANWWIDVVAFERLIDESKARRRATASANRAAPADPPVARLLEQAVELYGGDFLPEDVYEDWPISRRERSRELYLEALLALSYYERERGDLEMAISYAQKIVEREPYLEAVHLLLMELYSRLGRRSAALKQFQLCAKALAEEFNTMPSAETVELYNLISSAVRLDPGGMALRET